MGLTREVPVSEPFKDYLRRQLRASGVGTQLALAGATGIDYGQLNRIFTGKTQRPEILQTGESITDALRRSLQPLPPSKEMLTPDTLMEAFQNMSSQFDAEEGGFGEAPKFPQPMTFEFLLSFALNGHEIMAKIAGRALPSVGDNLRFAFNMAHAHVFDVATGRALRR